MQLSAGERPALVLPQRERVKCSRVTCFVILQCVAVVAGSSTIYECVWLPEQGMGDFDKLVRIMYLYDADACGYRMQSALAVSSLRLDNDTRGHSVLPIRWQPAAGTVSARLSATTRWYLHFSVAAHFVWMSSALLLKLLVKAQVDMGVQKLSLSIFLYVSISIVIFDLSMAIVYASHIKKSLTKGMILRYSGWSVEMKLQNYSDFGGWIPMIAAICWMKGIVIMFINIYCCRAIRITMRGVKKREVKRRLTLTENQPLPEAKSENPSDGTVLYFRTGEYIPFTGSRGIALF